MEVYLRMSRRRKYVNQSKIESDFMDDDFEEKVSSFLSYIISKNRSPYTVTYYKRELYTFMTTLESQGFTTRIRRLTGDLIADGYVRYRKDEDDVRYASIASTLRALKAFLNWCVKKGVIERNPMEDVPIGKVTPRTIETFTREQIREILSQPDRNLFVGLRDYAIMITLLETGVRVRELCDIKVDDVRFSDDQILIRGKNSEDRLVPFQSQTRKVLKHYVKARGDSHVDWLFISHDDDKMNRDSVRRRVSKYGRMANIDNVRCSPHTFRHTFAKMSVKNGADIFVLQKVLGHSSLDMVRVYVNMFSDDVAEAHAKFSPVENLIRH